LPAESQFKIRRLRREELPHDTIKLARFLIGKVVVHDLPCGRLSGRIVEAEAYPPGDPAGHHFRGPTPRIRSMYLHPGHAYVFFNYGAHFMLNVASEPEGVAGGILIRALEPLDGVEWMRRHRAAQLGRAKGGASSKASRKVANQAGGDISRETPRETTRGGATGVARKIVRADELPLVDLTRGPGRVAAALQIDRRHDGVDLCGEDSALWLGELVEPESAANANASGGQRVRRKNTQRVVAKTVRIGISQAADKLLRFYLRGNPFVSGPKRLLLPANALPAAKKSAHKTKRRKSEARAT
jgi:DNA-3-methyladenine glycosylase